MIVRKINMHDFTTSILATLARLCGAAMGGTMATADTTTVDLIPRPGYEVQRLEMMFSDRDIVLVNLLQAGVRK